MSTWNQLPTQSIIEKTRQALDANGIKTSLVQTGAEARTKVLAMIPPGSQVMNMTSITLETIGLTKDILESGKFEPVRATLNDPATSAVLKRQLGAAPEWAVGSVHAVTETGSVLIASNTGSQLPAYAYAAGQVIWVVGTQKIVPDVEIGTKRIYDYVLPLEADRAHKAYGAAGSNVSKLLIINKEIQPDRLHLIFVNEAIGF